MKAHTVAPSRPRPADGTHPGTRPAPRRPGAPGTARRSSWRVPATLAVLSAIPVVAGSLRLVEIAGGPHLLTANPRIAASPLPVVIHIVGATFYALAGAFQFSASFRHALALGAGTQTVTQGVGQAVFGTGELSTALSISAGWVVNAAVAEWIIRRPGARRRRRATVGGSR